MNSKSGFTLIELLAVLGLMALLAAIVVPSVTNIRDDLLKSTYSNQVKLINNAGLEWANDNINYIPSVIGDNNYNPVVDTDCSDFCACITVEDLILKGYLRGNDDEKKNYIDAISGESMNDLIVCARYDTNMISTRKVITYITK